MLSDVLGQRHWFDVEEIERREQLGLSGPGDVRDLISEVRRLRTYSCATARRLAVEQLGHHKTSLVQWKEPDGLLIPTEPDPGERQFVRERLRSAIHTLEWVIALMPEVPGD